LYGQPPEQPLPAEEAQSTSYYSAKSPKVPSWIAFQDSETAMVEKAQHDPHCP